MVGQEILVLFIMVRIRALQPKIQPPLAGGLIFVLSRPFDLKHRSTTSRFYKRNAVKSLRLTRSRALARARESVRSFISSKVCS